MPLATRFPGLTVEGAFFPPDALETLAPRVALAPGKRRDKAAAQAFLPRFLDPDSYGLYGGTDIDDEAQLLYSRLKKQWKTFDTFRNNVIDVWLKPVLKELGYGTLQRQHHLETGGKQFPIHYVANCVPIHLVDHRIDLDTRLNNQPSPHAVAQEFLNRSDPHLFALVSNGLQLRLLRDNVRIVRQAYLEFDLEAIFQEDNYATFAILFRMLHASRFTPLDESNDPAKCLFEQAAAHASSTAIRAMETLRGNIEKALRELGGGFLHHAPLRQKLRDGTLSRRAYHQQLVRMLYRFLFLFIAEDRKLLHPEDTDTITADRYSRTYSMNRVRTLAIAIKGAENHHDIYESTRLVLRILGGTEPCALLGLVPLGSLFRPELTPDLNDAPLPNKDYLAAIRALVTTTDATNTRRTVDLSHLGAEEIGSVYERLLEIEPVITWDPPRFDTPSTAGNERKITGSYYTPDSLVQTVLDSALDPVVDKALAEAGSVMVARENALLNLRVCDPACGSGHFLVAAARRLALRLARVRALDHEPSPPEVRAALRAVVSRCIFGVDLNPMAVELCQFALWLEAMSPGKPLGFLRHHIRMGNSLMGATPELVEAGIPDDAFDTIEGDDRRAAAGLKKQNKQERNQQGDLFGGDPMAVDYAAYLRRVRALDLAPDETLGQIAAKSTEFDELTNSEVTYRQTTLKFDIWCAAFVQMKVPSDYGGLTQSVLQRVTKNPYDLAPHHFAEARRLAEAYHFFHWNVMFPTVFEKGGFDCVLGNPPWERVKLQEQEYFAANGRIDIAEARNASVRKKLIEALASEDPRAYATFMDARRAAEAESHFARHSGKFPLCGRGDVNTYALFAELCRQITGPQGRAGFIVPTGIATDDTTKEYFKDMVEKRSLVSLYDFENRAGLFPEVDSRMKFCAITTVQSGHEGAANLVCFAHTVEELADEQRRFTLTPEEFGLLNPNTRTLPIFRTRRDAEITKAIYRRVPVLLREGPPEENPWGVEFMRMLDMANDSGLFRTEPGEGLVPLYQANMLHQFDHRWATFEFIKNKVDSRYLTLTEKQDPNFVVQPQYWVPNAEVDARLKGRWDKEWLMGWRDVCRNTDIRTTISTIFPNSGVNDKFLLIMPQETSVLCTCFLAMMDSFILDFAARQKVGGTALKYFVIRQFPVLPPSAFTLHEAYISERVLELVYTAVDMEPFARDMGYAGPPFAWDPARRFTLRCELDALFFHLYGICRDDVAYIMDTFPIVRRHDEESFGSYRTKEEILRVYDTLK